MKRLMFYCQYVFGVGHLVRCVEIARALAREFRVTFVTGGEPVEGMPVPAELDLVRLPALEAPLGFQGLRPCDPAAGLEQIRDARKHQLLDLFDTVRPDVLIVELFPFGRKQFSFELIPLLERARAAGCFAVCSLRDILVRKQKQEEHEHRACLLANAYLDLVLVHGDPSLVTIEETLSRAGDLRCELRYTGYVVKSAPAVREFAVRGGPTIVGSIGGGRSEEGRRLLESLIAAAQVLKNRLPHYFRIFAGPLMPEDAYTNLQRLAAGVGNVQLQRFTPDMHSQLAAADLSVSLGGYNTTMDVLRTGVRALMLPAADSGDQEQALRAAKLARLGVIETIDLERLTPLRLAARIVHALRRPQRGIPLDLQGAENTRALLKDFCTRRDRMAVRAV
jgi:predicted glycosyltransferase